MEVNIPNQPNITHVWCTLHNTGSLLVHIAKMCNACIYTIVYVTYPSAANNDEVLNHQTMATQSLAENHIFNKLCTMCLIISVIWEVVNAIQGD